MSRPLHVFVWTLTLVACSPKPDGPGEPTTDEPPRPRGDPTPPAWAVTWLDARLPNEVASALFKAGEPIIPEDLGSRHALCRIEADPDGNPLDGARDLRTHWRLPSGHITRYGGSSPTHIVFRPGELTAGMEVSIRVVDEDDFSEDDRVGSVSGRFVVGSPFRASAPGLRVECRSTTREALRDALRTRLRYTWPRDIADIHKAPDAEQSEDVRNAYIRQMQAALTGIGKLLGWDDPDVWPLTRALTDVGPPTDNGQPIP